MASIAKAVAQIKSDPRGPINESIAEAVCRRLGLRWANTPLTPPVTLALLAQQVLRGNVSNPELIRAEGLNVTAAAYCTAKGRRHGINSRHDCFTVPDWRPDQDPGDPRGAEGQ